MKKFIPADEWLAKRLPDNRTDPRQIEMEDLQTREIQDLMQPGYGR